MNIHLPAIFDVHQGYKVLTHCHILYIYYCYYYNYHSYFCSDWPELLDDYDDLATVVGYVSYD